MIKIEFTKEIVDAGLSKEQAIVYETLLKIGESPASKIAKSIQNNNPLSRPLVYKVLEELIAIDLAEKNEKSGKVATFSPKHPIAINKTIDEQKEKIEQIKKQFMIASGKLTSLFNLSHGKPGVQFYEGKEGIWEVLMDSLSSSEEILTYADLEAIEKYIPDLNAEYSAMREEKGVKKRGLVIDSEKSREFLKSYKGNTTTTKLIPPSKNIAPFQTIIQIYDQKISYITLTDKYLIGAIINDQFIANTHKFLFESMWEMTKGQVI